MFGWFRRKKSKDREGLSRQHWARGLTRKQQDRLERIALEHLRDLRAGVAEQLRDGDEGAHVFLVRRGVHGDAGVGLAVDADAEVAPEAGIGRGRGEVDAAAGETALKPCLELRESLHGGLSMFV